MRGPELPCQRQFRLHNVDGDELLDREGRGGHQGGESHTSGAEHGHGLMRFGLEDVQNRSGPCLIATAHRRVDGQVV